MYLNVEKAGHITNMFEFEIHELLSNCAQRLQGNSKSVKKRFHILLEVFVKTYELAI